MPCCSCLYSQTFVAANPLFTTLAHGAAFAVSNLYPGVGICIRSFVLQCPPPLPRPTPDCLPDCCYLRINAVPKQSYQPVARTYLEGVRIPGGFYKPSRNSEGELKAAAGGTNTCRSNTLRPDRTRSASSSTAGGDIKVSPGACSAFPCTSASASSPSLVFCGAVSHCKAPRHRQPALERIEQTVDTAAGVDHLAYERSLADLAPGDGGRLMPAQVLLEVAIIQCITA